MLVGNKLDLAQMRRVVETVDGEQLASAWGCSFFEISAQSSDDVHMVFHNITKQVDNIAENRCLIDDHRI